MKKIVQAAVILFFLVGVKAHSLDTLAFVQINNTYLVNPSTLEFQLNIQRLSDNWERFVNGTFTFTFPEQAKLLPNEYEIQLFESDLPESVISGAVLPKEDYLIEYQKYDERFSITILGPEKYEDCFEIPKDTTVLLGKFRIINTSGEPITDRLVWMQPQNYFQAVAYKIQYDSISKGVTWYYSDDNVEMHDGVNNTFAINYDDTEPFGFVFDDFWVRYLGQRNLEYGWRTKSEIKVLGYTVLRGMKIFENSVEYSDTLGTFLENDFYNPDFKSKGVSQFGFTYGDFPDQVQYRGGNYSYALWGRLINKEGRQFDSLLAIRDVPVPHAVIVEATAVPNPFSHSTTINYKVDDDVYMTAYVSDLVGKRLAYLTDPETGQPINNLLVKMGRHSTVFAATDIVSQGFYNVIFIAYPVEDSTIEISRAVVKIQYVQAGG